MTTKQEIRGWFDRGVAQGATHLLVVCDTFDHDDYPVFVSPTEDVRVVEQTCRSASMQRVMEVYDLRMDKEFQLGEFRAFNYGPPFVPPKPKWQGLCPPIGLRNCP